MFLEALRNTGNVTLAADGGGAPQHGLRCEGRLSQDRTSPLHIATGVAPAAPSGAEDHYQLPLPLDAFADLPQLRHRRRRRVRAADNAEDALEALYEERLRGMRAPRSVLTYRWLRKAVLRVAKGARGEPLTLGELFALPDLLGLALTNDRNPDGARISKSTLAHRGTAMRSVATLLYVELAAALGREPHAVLDQARRGAAERVGGGFRIAGASPRRHGGPTPGMAESTAIIEALAERLEAVLSRSRCWRGRRSVPVVAGGRRWTSTRPSV